MKIPDNLEVLATHGSASYPDILKPFIRPEFDERLVKNYSDFATWPLVQGIPEAQRLRPMYGRIAGDAGRALNNPDLHRDKVDHDKDELDMEKNPLGITQDFNGIQVFTQRLPDALKKELEQYWILFHREILNRIVAPHGNPNNEIIVYDTHDTGNLLLDETPDKDVMRLVKNNYHMPPVILSNFDGGTASQEVMDNLSSAFKHHFGLESGDVRQNGHYKGGYVTQRYGLPAEEIKGDLEKAGNPKRHVVQIELGRYLFVDEKTQKINENAMAHFREKFTAVVTEVADGLRSA